MALKTLHTKETAQIYVKRILEEIRVLSYFELTLFLFLLT